MGGLAPTGSPLPHVEGPPLGHTGGFNEPTCLICHAEFELNPAGGVLELDGLPEQFEPGHTYRVRIVLAGEGMTNGGFELAFRYADGAVAGRQAGAVRARDEAVVVRDSLGIQYAHQSRSGSHVSDPDRIEWVLDWTAPSAERGVIVHVAANSANGDNSPLGDWVLAMSREVPAPTR